MSRRILLAALAALAVVALSAAPRARAQAMPNITAPKTAANNAAAATNAHIQAEQNTGSPPPQSAQPRGGASSNAPYSPRLTQQPVKPGAQQPAKPTAQQPAAKPPAPPAPAPAKPGAAPAQTPAKPGAAPATAQKGPVTAAKPGAPPPAGAQKGVTPPAPDQTSSVSQRGGKSEIELLRETFTYQAEGRRDPFLSLMRTGDLRPMVSDLRLVAVIYDPAGRSVAILRDLQTKEQYRVRVGQTLGRMRVNAIRPQQVIFTIEEIGMTRQEALGMNPTTTARAQ